MIFQDPMTSLNPYMRISDQITEPLELHENIKGKAALTRAIDALLTDWHGQGKVDVTGGSVVRHDGRIRFDPAS